MTPKTIEYYDWTDIREYLCEQLNISVNQFMSYHDVVGGESKNLWHVWLWIVDDQVINGCIMPFYLLYGDDDSMEYFKRKLVEQFGKWALDIVGPLESLSKEIGLPDTNVWIHYSW